MSATMPCSVTQINEIPVTINIKTGVYIETLALIQYSIIHIVKEHFGFKAKKQSQKYFSKKLFFNLQHHLKFGGAMRDRTADLLDANQALSQLSYSPVNLCRSLPGAQFYAFGDVKQLLFLLNFELCKLVGLGGFEPPTSPLSGVRSNQLSYRPNNAVSFYTNPSRLDSQAYRNNQILMISNSPTRNKVKHFITPLFTHKKHDC